MSRVRGQSRPPPSLQPENILCVNTTGPLVKIIDFGLARRYHLGGWHGRASLEVGRAGGRSEGVWEWPGSCALSSWPHLQV